MKLSKYIVTQEFFDQKEEKHKILIYSTLTCKFMSLSIDLFYLLSSQKFHLIDPDLVKKFSEFKILAPSDKEEFFEVIQENIEESQNNKIFYLVLQPSAQCQLGCGYCGQNHTKSALSDSDMEHVTLFVERSLKSKKFEKFIVSWFGSEPLTGLSKILSLSKKFIDLSNQYQILFEAKMVTNGVFLTPSLAKRLVEECLVTSFEITLDGDKEAHDQRRYTKSYQPTFSRIFQNIQNLSTLNLNFQISIRCNTDSRNKEHVLPLLQKLKEAHLEKRVSFYVAPIHSWGNDAHALAAHQKDFAEWEIEWFISMKELGFQVSYLPRRNKVVCMAVDAHAYLIDPRGGVFRCTEVSLVPSYEENGKNVHNIGHVSQPPFDEEKAQFSSFNEELRDHSSYPCRDCHLLPICGGRCPKEWKEGRAACPPFKFNMPSRLLLAYLGTRG